MILRYLPHDKEDSWTGLDTFTNHWFTHEFGGSQVEKFVIIVPRVEIHDNKQNAEDFRWHEIHHAWCQIKSSQPGGRVKAWHVIQKYGDEIAPGLGVYRFKESKSLCLFWLSPDASLIETQTRLADLLPKISAYWHIVQGRGIFHAAGILHKEHAFLFAGVSGAGKSTVSSLSKARGHQIIHDDHVVAYKERGKWLVSDISHSLHDAPLNAVLFLVQDTVDELIPLRSTTTAMRLLDNLHEHGRYILFRDVLRKAFITTAELARQVPGFELHFRRNADFWKLIDEQFPD